MPHLAIAMPGAGGTATGFAAFVGVKLAGYSVSTVYFAWRHAARRWPLWLFGPTRTAVGVGAGIAVAAALAMTDLGPGWFLAALLPVRVLEWTFVLWLFFGRGAIDRRRRRVDVLIGTVWSYALDAAAIWAAFA